MCGTEVPIPRYTMVGWYREYRGDKGEKQRLSGLLVGVVGMAEVIRVATMVGVVRVVGFQQGGLVRAVSVHLRFYRGSESRRLDENGWLW